MSNTSPWASVKVGRPEVVKNHFTLKRAVPEVTHLEMAEFVHNVEGWAEKMGISETSPQAQALKMVEELGEIYTAIKEGDLLEVLDGVGDAHVVGVIANLQLRNREGNANYDFLKVTEGIKFEPNSKPESLETLLIELGEVMGQFSRAVVRAEYDEYVERIGNVIDITNRILVSVRHSLKADNALSGSMEIYMTPTYACSMAWDVISKRTGKVKDGVLIKDEDLKK